MKVNSRSYKGIEFVQLNDLPKEQHDKILQTLDEDLIIKILIDKKLLNHCVQYKDYECWYETVYTAEPKVQPKQQPVNASSVQIALDKI